MEAMTTSFPTAIPGQINKIVFYSGPPSDKKRQRIAKHAGAAPVLDKTRSQARREAAADLQESRNSFDSRTVCPVIADYSTAPATREARADERRLYGPSFGLDSNFEKSRVVSMPGLIEDAPLCSFDFAKIWEGMDGDAWYPGGNGGASIDAPLSDLDTTSHLPVNDVGAVIPSSIAPRQSDLSIPPQTVPESTRQNPLITASSLSSASSSTSQDVNQDRDHTPQDPMGRLELDDTLISPLHSLPVAEGATSEQQPELESLENLPSPRAACAFPVTEEGAGVPLHALRGISSPSRSESGNGSACSSNVADAVDALCSLAEHRPPSPACRIDSKQAQRLPDGIDGRCGPSGNRDLSNDTNKASSASSDDEDLPVVPSRRRRPQSEGHSLAVQRKADLTSSKRRRSLPVASDADSPRPPQKRFRRRRVAASDAVSERGEADIARQTGRPNDDGSPIFSQKGHGPFANCVTDGTSSHTIERGVEVHQTRGHNDREGDGAGDGANAARPLSPGLKRGKRLSRAPQRLTSRITSMLDSNTRERNFSSPPTASQPRRGWRLHRQGSHAITDLAPKKSPVRFQTPNLTTSRSGMLIGSLAARADKASFTTEFDGRIPGSLWRA
ncbi:hypothetical protein LTR74_018492 [Friedmanniomyces endolithicus]|nr:hypothetical protein LTR74_018492 [Friedmanniomyces endolithicus]